MSDREIAKAICDQISIQTKMACGYREPVILPRGLGFKVGRGSHIKIVLNGRDLYDVEHSRKKRGAWEMITLEQAGDIDCEALAAAAEVERRIRDHAGPINDLVEAAKGNEQ